MPDVNNMPPMTDTLLETCTCSALRQAARHVTRAYDDELGPVGLGLNQYAILAKLERHGPQGLQELADSLVMDRSTLGHLLRPLERRSLVTIGVAPADRRGRVIALAAEGMALMRRAKPLWAKAEARLETAFGAGAALELRLMLKRVTTAEFDTPPQES